MFNAPKEFSEIMSEFPCEVVQKIKGKYEFILFFAKNLADANVKPLVLLSKRNLVRIEI